MALTKCTICGATTVAFWKKCKSAAYCSIRCQKRDWPLHRLLCGELPTFLENNPRPAEEDEKAQGWEGEGRARYKLALLLPIDSETP